MKLTIQKLGGLWFVYSEPSHTMIYSADKFEDAIRMIRFYFGEEKPV